MDIYSLPQKYKNMINDEFAKVFIEELKKVFVYATDEKNIIGILYMNAGSSGTHEAFENTCKSLGLNNFLEASKLPWYDYDLFIDEVSDTVGEVFYGKEKYEKICEQLLDEVE